MANDNSPVALLPGFQTNKQTKILVIVCFLLILILAVFFRTWKLNTIPPGLYPDEAINANTALEICNTGEFQVFYPENHGREGLFFWLISFVFSFLGPSILSFKLVSAIAGILTVLGQYLLTLEFFRIVKWRAAKITALLSAFFLSISFWHINFSRIGFRAILVPLILTFSFYFFFKGLRTKRMRDFLFCGLIFGLGFYTYISFRLAILSLGFALLFWFFVALKEGWKNKYLSSAALLLIGTFIVALPIGLYFLKNPEYFVSRAMGVSVFGAENPIKEFFISLGKHLAMFNFYGDPNWRHNLAGMPQLAFGAGILFLVGIIYSIKKWKEEFINLKRKNSAALPVLGGYTFLFVWFFALLLPSVLTVEGTPHSLRSIGVIPIAYLFAGIGAYLVYRWLASLWQKKNWPLCFLWLIIKIFFIVSIVSAFITYFVIWANRPALEEAFTKRFTDVGQELNALPEKTNKFVIESEGELPTEVPKFIQRTEGRQEAVYLEPEKVISTNFSPGDFIFTMNKEIRFLDSVRERFPNGILHEKERIWIFEVR